MLYRLPGPILALFLLSGLTAPIFALGPDNYGYTAAATTFSFEDITANGTPAIPILDGTDDAVVTVPIGFAFTFYGVTYTTVSVSTNGILTFGGTDNDYHHYDFRTTAPPANLKTIAALWHDLTFQFLGSDEAYYYTPGTPGNRRLIVQWNFAQSASSPGFDTVTFQVKLFEGSNNIEFHYDDATFDDDNSESNGLQSTVGIRDVNGQTTGRNLVWAYNQAIITDSSAIKFTAPQFRITAITRQANGSIVLKCTGAPSKPNWVEATTDLKNTAFARLGTSVTADALGNFQFTDATPGTRHFYRVGFP